LEEGDVIVGGWETFFYVVEEVEAVFYGSLSVLGALLLWEMFGVFLVIGLDIVIFLWLYNWVLVDVIYFLLVLYWFYFNIVIFLLVLYYLLFLSFLIVYIDDGSNFRGDFVFLCETLFFCTFDFFLKFDCIALFDWFFLSFDIYLLLYLIILLNDDNS
jgi:hypothetical protein